MAADSAPWDRLRELPLVVESYDYERQSRTFAYGFERVTTLVRLAGGGAEGLGEDVSPYEDEAPTLHAVGPVLPLAGEWTLESFCDHLAALDQWPIAPEWDPMRRWRNWAFESAALDLALNQAGRALHEAVGREPRPVRFVNSLGLGEPPTFDPIERRLARHPGLRFKLDVTADWTPELIGEVAATGAVEIVDFKGHYGMDTAELPQLMAMYERVVEAFPDALLEDAHDLPEVAALLGSQTDRISYDAPIHTVDGHRRDAAGPARAQHQAVPGRRPALAVRRLRRVRRPRAHHLRRRHGRAGRRPRPDPAAGLAVPPGRAERHRPGRLQRRDPVRRPAAESASARPGADRVPPRRARRRASAAGASAPACGGSSDGGARTRSGPAATRRAWP